MRLHTPEPECLLQREVKTKHQQSISEVSLWAYWTPSFVWDVVSYVFPLVMVIVIINAFQVKAYTELRMAH
jgi:ATP-binding cassette subfamily A (ABC1) protein 1